MLEDTMARKCKANLMLEDTLAWTLWLETHFRQIYISKWE